MLALQYPIESIRLATHRTPALGAPLLAGSYFFGFTGGHISPDPTNASRLEVTETPELIQKYAR